MKHQDIQSTILNIFYVGAISFAVTVFSSESTYADGGRDVVLTPFEPTLEITLTRDSLRRCIADLKRTEKKLKKIKPKIKKTERKLEQAKKEGDRNKIKSIRKELRAQKKQLKVLQGDWQFTDKDCDKIEARLNKAKNQ
jgi:septal ring factor EnvC (AmiA/AmiB activator)